MSIITTIRANLADLDLASRYAVLKALADDLDAAKNEIIATGQAVIKGAAADVKVGLRETKVLDQDAVKAALNDAQLVAVALKSKLDKKAVEEIFGAATPLVSTITTVVTVKAKVLA
jgi:hypothetical protein